MVQSFATLGPAGARPAGRRRLGCVRSALDGLVGRIANSDAESRCDAGSVPASVLANRWVARDDARNYIVLGDPAAK